MVPRVHIAKNLGAYSFGIQYGLSDAYQTIEAFLEAEDNKIVEGKVIIEIEWSDSSGAPFSDVELAFFAIDTIGNIYEDKPRYKYIFPASFELNGSTKIHTLMIPHLFGGFYVKARLLSSEDVGKTKMRIAVSERQMKSEHV